MTGNALGKRALLSLSGTALIAGMVCGTGPAMAAGPGRPASKPEIVSASASFSATADATSGRVEIDSVSAGAEVSPGVASAARYTCIVETRKNRNLVGYKPLTVHNGGRSHSMTWLLSPYSVKHARFLASGPTFQVEMCLVGSGHSWNYWHQWFDGGAIVLKYTRALMIGSKWGTKVVNGSANATLNFQLSKGVASIGGSTQVKDYATHSGDTGGDPNLAVPKAWQKYDINRVNAFYVSSHDLFFQGTGSSEGNVGHALYEFDTGGTVNFKYGAAVQVRAFCAEASCPAGF